MSNFKIGIGVVVWIEEKEQLPELERCLDSLTNFYPVIVINGKWGDIEGANPRSISKAYELIDSYSNVIHLESPNNAEYVNRNKYIIQARKMDCDCLIWVDSDEWVELPLGYDFLCRGIRDVFRKQPDRHTFLVHFYDERFGGCCYKKRGIRHPASSLHRNKHNELWYHNNEILRYPAKAPRGLIIHQDKKFRTQKREENMKDRNVSNPIH